MRAVRDYHWARTTAVAIVCVLAASARASLAEAQSEVTFPPDASVVLEVPAPPASVLVTGPGLGEDAAARPTSPVLGPGADASGEHDALRLEAWLELHAQRAEGPRLLGAGAAIVGGIALVAVEAFLLSDAASSETLPVTLACLGLGVGVIDLALGIFRLASPSIPERRLARWRALRLRGPMLGEDVARFEGEIRGELAVVEEMRWLMVALGAGLGAAALAGVGLTAGLARDEPTQMIGYIASGGAGLLGLLVALLPWIDRTPDDEWREIEQGHYPRLSSLTPWMSTEGGGLALAGSF